jgi:hypothetical protein
VRPSIEFTLKDLTRELVDVTIDDLEVVEDGVPQKLEAFQEAVTPVAEANSGTPGRSLSRPLKRFGVYPTSFGRRTLHCVVWAVVEHA